MRQLSSLVYYYKDCLCDSQSIWNKLRILLDMNTKLQSLCLKSVIFSRYYGIIDDKENIFRD